MEFFRKDFDCEQFTLYPFGDWHLGSKQCDEDFIKQVIEEIATTDNAYWVGMGDLMENALVGSRSDVYTQVIPPEEQMMYICELLEPIKDKALFLIAGNHEARTHRLTGIRSELFISQRLDIPYKQFSCYAFFTPSAKLPNNKRKKLMGFRCYFHHDYGGGWTPGGKVNKAHKLREITPNADATFSGHFHITSRIPYRWAEIGSGGKHIWNRTGYDYITGSALKWDSSYAEEKAKPMAAMEFVKVTFQFGERYMALNKKGKLMRKDKNGKTYRYKETHLYQYDNARQIYETIQPKEK